MAISFFVHAGGRPGIPLEEQRDEDLLWIRQEFLSWTTTLAKSLSSGTRLSQVQMFDQTGLISTPGAILILEGETIDFI